MTNPGDLLPPEQWSKNDIIPPEGLMRGMLDRSFDSINPFYITTMGLERTPLQAAVDIVRATGHVSLLDVGCGTGHGLRTWADAVAQTAGCDKSQIEATGISLHDYSRESRSDATRRACQPRGRIRYIVGDAKKMPGIAHGSMDVVLAHASMFYANDTLSWLTPMLYATRRGGSVFFNLRDEQSYSSSPAMEFMYKLDDFGFDTVIAPMNIPSADGSNYTTMHFCYIRKPEQVNKQAADRWRNRQR